MQEGGPDDDEEGIPGHVSESKSDSEEVIPCSLLYLFIVVYELRLLVICRLLDNAIMFILQEEELPTGQDSAFFVQPEGATRADHAPAKLPTLQTQLHRFFVPLPSRQTAQQVEIPPGSSSGVDVVGGCQSNDDDDSPRKQALRAEIKHLRAENLKLKARVQHRSIYLMWQY